MIIYLVEDSLSSVATCGVSVGDESVAPVSVWRSPTAQLPR